MRQVCNIVYAQRVEWLESDERAAFDRDLLADPRKRRSGAELSKNVELVMRLMGGETP